METVEVRKNKLDWRFEQREKFIPVWKKQQEKERKARLKRLDLLRGFRLYPETPEAENDLVQSVGFCFECGDDVVVEPESQEVVCVFCGRVWGRSTTQEHIPIQEENVNEGHAEGSYSPTGHLDYENSLGSKNDRNSLADVLSPDEMPEEARLILEESSRRKKVVMDALTDDEDVTVKAPTTPKHDPFTWGRSNHLRVTFLAPLIRELKKFGSEFMKKHELRGNHWFANELGCYLEDMGEYYLGGMGKEYCNPWRTAAAVFTLMFRDVYRARYYKIRDEMGNDGGVKTRFPELCLSDAALEEYDDKLHRASPKWKNCHLNVLPKLEG